jgi:hypothetical protein
MVGFDDLYRQGGAVTWQAGKEDVVRQVVGVPRAARFRGHNLARDD